MAVFITGGHGHIGSWAAYFLAKEGEQIILFDTNPMAPDHLGEVSKNITFVKGDVREELGFEPECSVEEGVQKYARWIENKLK